ncbi:TPA: hypothetical protein N0F65_011423 [Lagenidium giganteum]|uniref:Phospholipid-transporting ATPase n=1 Tax=Lagenidium giganteum TaxID=4803 RepID=A0AAV2ZDZ3_9STRA|nr:TPA: hypothetical protein N0F65_011423 [Lagenidium giganteum]
MTNAADGDHRALVVPTATAPYRRVLLGASVQSQPYPTNAVKTSIYTPYNFLAKNLFKQFTRFSNIYFLFITALQLIPQVTSSHGAPTMIVPLSFIIIVSGVRDLIEDLQRHKADDQQNHAPVRRADLQDVRTRTFTTARCADVCVGQLVRVTQNEEVPADIVLLASSSSSNGQCFVMTANLDGESSLKPRYVHHELSIPAFRDCFSREGELEEAAFTRLSGVVIECEPPNRRIDRFKATLHLKPDKSSELDISHVLLRGTQLKDTSWVVGVVVYTGDDTRVRQNSSETPIKQSWLYKFINKVTLWVVLAQMVILTIAVIIEKQMMDSKAVQQNEYVPDDFKHATTVDYLWLFLAYMLLFSNFVPISLQVTVDFTRYFQSLVIHNDRELKQMAMAAVVAAGGSPHSLGMKRGVRVQSSELNEELGLIEHIFTDKTGTLTCNRMEFQSCHVDGKTYDFNEERGELCVVEQALHASLTSINTVMPNRLDSVLQRTPQMIKFLVNLAVNNSISPSVVPSTTSPNSHALDYSGPSPDERALVIAASRSGVELRKKDSSQIIVQVLDQERVFHILRVFEFTSDRKKSSIVCKTSDGTIMLYCKGADSVILPALHDKNNAGKVHTAKEQMKVYCSNGLRVLCVAERELTVEEYNAWEARYLAMRDSKSATEEDVERVVAEMETQLTLIGVSGIEDKIQSGAPEALEKFREAGIKVWMLTGDRPDTATNVAYSVRLISGDMKVIKLCDNQWLESKMGALHFMQKELKALEAPQQAQLALLVNDAAVEAIKTFGIEKEFLELCSHCESVLCARISPKQKEFIIDMVRKHYPDKVTMAVGDGANDVPMIQTAHIGVGIAGEEGHQASDASDYSIPTFNSLQRLVLVHGRWMNRRISILTLYIFYKNVLLVLPQFIYGGYCLYSGQSTYFDFLLQLFNVGFTSLPVLFFSVLDKDVSSHTLLAYPKLYQDGFHHSFLNMKVFAYWMFEATVASVLIVLVPANLIPLVPWSGQGKDNDLWSFGLAQNFIVVFLANVRLVLELSSHHSYVLLLCTVSITFWWIIVYVMQSYIGFSREFYGILYTGCLTNMYLCTLFCVVLGLVPGFVPKLLDVFFAPNARTICREIDHLGQPKKHGFETVFPSDKDDPNYKPTSSNNTSNGRPL